MAYLPLSTANLPDPVIDPAQGASPEDYFNTVLYTGNGGTSRSITGMGFQADFLWHKDRSAARNHSLVDVIRGTNDLQSNATDAERSMPSFVSFDSDGFTVTQDGSTNPNWNENSITKVVWGWKANGSGVSNNAGSITSTVSANTTSGFSVVSWTGNGTSGSIGHGLGVTPDVIIIKGRDNSDVWVVKYSDTNIMGTSQYLFLDRDWALYTSGAEVNSIGSSTFSVNNAGSTNGNTLKYIGYCFHSVEGFSKFGSYVGNGGDGMAGVFVYTGFRPAYLLVKNATTGTTNWIIKTAKTAPYNQMNNALQANLSDAEQASLSSIDFLSNGFGVRNNGSYTNTSGNTYIYMAFAENPFKYSNAR